MPYFYYMLDSGTFLIKNVIMKLPYMNYVYGLKAIDVKSFMLFSKISITSLNLF